MKIRPPSGLEEVRKLVELWKMLIEDPEASERLFSVDREAEDRWVEWIVEAYRESPENILVAEEEGKLVGFIASRRFEYPLKLKKPLRYAVITDLYVTPEYRGRGVGRLLLERCMESLRRRGYDRARLSVWVKNRRAIRLYLALGFKPHTMVMVKNLNSLS